MASAAELALILSAIDRGFEKNVQAANKQTSGLGKTLESVGTIAAGFLTGATVQKGIGMLVSGFNDAVGAASNLQQSLGGVEAIFKDAAGPIHEFGKISAESAGLSQRAFNELAAPLGAMLKNTGLGMDEVAGKTIELTKRASDMAATFGGKTEDALNAIQSALRGELDPIERFGVSLKQADLQAEALALGLIPVEQNSMKVKDAELDLAEAQQRLNELQRQGVEVNKPTKLQLDALALAQRKYNETVEKHGASSTQAQSALLSLNRAREAAKTTTSGQAASTLDLQRAQLAVEQAQQKVAEATAGSAGEMDNAAKIQAAYSLIMKQTTDAAGQFGRESDSVAGKTAIQQAKMEELQATIGTKLLPVQLKITEAKLRFADLLATKVLPIIEELYAKHWPGLSKAIGDTVAFIEKNWPKIQPIIEFAVKHVKTQIEGMIQTIEGVVKVVTGVIDLVDALIHGRWSDAWTAANQILEGALDIIHGTIKRMFGALPGLILEQVQYAGNWLYDTGAKIIDGLWQGMKDKWESVKSWIGERAKDVENLLKKPLEILSPSRVMYRIGSQTMEGFANGLRDAGESMVMPAITSIANRVAEVGDALVARTKGLSVATPLGNGTYQKAGGTIVDGYGNVVGSGGGSPGGLSAGSGGFTAAELAQAQALGITLVPSTGAQRPIGSTAYNSSGQAYIVGPQSYGPEFEAMLRAKRGYAKGTNFVPSDGPAYLHRGEAVIPANQNRGGITVNFAGANFYGTLDERMKQQIVAAVRDALLGGGFRGVLASR